MPERLSTEEAEPSSPHQSSSPVVHKTAPAGHYKLVVEGLLFGMQAVLGIVWMAPAPLLSIIIEHYSINRAAAGLVISLISIALTFAAIPGAVVAAKIGAKRAVLLGGLLMATAIFVPIIDSFPVYLTTRLLLGGGLALIGPAVAALMMQWFESQELPIVNGLNLVAVSIGISIALFIAVPMSEAMGWKTTLGLTGLLALGLALAWLVLGRERASPRQETGVFSASTSWRSIGQVLKNRVTLLMGLAVTGPFALYNALTSWLPTYYNQAFQMPLASASSLTGLLNLVGIPAALLGGILPSAIGLRRPFLLVPGVAMPFLALGVFLTPNPLILYPAVVALGICLWVYVPSIITLPMELRAMTPALAGVMIATGFGIGDVGAFVSPIAVGWVADATGSYVPAFLLWSGLSWTLLVAALLLPETGPKGRVRPVSQASAP